MIKGSMIVEGIHADIPSDTYHSLPDTWSSSQIKKAWKDIEVFHNDYILKKGEKLEGGFLDVGTFFHTGILEPEKVLAECVVFPGAIRRGKEWDKFKADNASKCIVSKAEMSQVDTLIAAVHNSPVAMGRIGRGKPEVSAFLKIRVSGGEIYAIKSSKRLGKYGWESVKSVPTSGTDLWLKCRADSLNDSFILDLKSTSGNTKDEFLMRGAVSKYSYDLSAALYLDVFSAVTGKTISEFIWVFASKDVGNCQSYMASSENIQIGRAKWKKGILNMVEGIETNWIFEDHMKILEPNGYELEHIKPKAEDLL